MTKLQTTATAVLAMLATTADAGLWKERRLDIQSHATLPVEAVAADWEACGVFTLSVVSNNRHDISVRFEDYGHTPTWVAQGGQVVGRRGYVMGGQVLLNSWWFANGWEGRERGVLCHEVGHVLGLPHLYNTDSCLADSTRYQGPGKGGCSALRALYGR